MKRAAPVEEPVELSSDGSVSSDSDDDAGKGFRLPNSSKSAASGEGESCLGDFFLSEESTCALGS